MTYVLHYAPDNASLIVRMALEEMSLPYETRLVDRRAQAQHSAEYRALNPAGTIPALETPDGVLAETAAILLWLADRHRQMAPRPEHPSRGSFLQMLFFLSNTIQAMLRMRFYPEKFVGDDPAAHVALQARLTTPDPATIKLQRAFDVVERFMDRRGSQLDILDPYIGCLARWARLYPAEGPVWFDLTRYPALALHLEMVEQHPAIRRAADAEGLGPTIFTAPRLPDPPEGSVV